MKRPPATVFALAAVLAVSACAQVPKNPDERAEFEAVNDPLEPMNRKIFDLNLALDKAIMRPVARFYVDYVPARVRTGAHNLLNNLREPWVFVNDVLQGKPHQAADALGRFMINSTWGLAGVFDVVASHGGAKFKDNDMGITFAVWGIPEGPYLMLPFYGPSNPRDLAGKAAGWEAEPVDYVLYNYYTSAAVDAHTGLGLLDDRARTLEPLDDLERNSIDFYAAVRSLYRQERASEAGVKPLQY